LPQGQLTLYGGDEDTYDEPVHLWDHRPRRLAFDKGAFKTSQIAHMY
jgi:hypothetical protein